jgi:hypothetical protein
MLLRRDESGMPKSWLPLGEQESNNRKGHGVTDHKQKRYQNHCLIDIVDRVLDVPRIWDILFEAAGPTRLN